MQKLFAFSLIIFTITSCVCLAEQVPKVAAMLSTFLLGISWPMYLFTSTGKKQLEAGARLIEKLKADEDEILN